jgi:hypothetical protein
VYDLDDPNRPRFSLPELRDILQVRNVAKKTRDTIYSRNYVVSQKEFRRKRTFLVKKIREISRKNRYTV